jgi:AraC-like DNA-binding protein
MAVAAGSVLEPVGPEERLQRSGPLVGHPPRRRYLSSIRLEHAARLLERRASLKTGQPLSVIAYACGFRDYTHFARGFRRRFGCAPGATGS